MDRKKSHKVKKERPESSRAKDHRSRHKDVDLTHYINDRVELLQQAFAVLKPRDILAIAPEDIKDVSFDKMKEMCLEELLGISTKRLNSVLDGTEPPSDTESSDSSDKLACLDAISLDSISSDEADLSPKSINKKGKKKRCKNKVKHRKDKKKNKASEGPGQTEDGRSQTESAGLTVLELLELQARARAIKAQLHAEQLSKVEATGESMVPTAAPTAASDEDDVLIKEEPLEVVELSSGDDEHALGVPKKEAPETETIPTKDQVTDDGTKIVTKRNDLTIIVPKPQTSKRIKLKRNNVLVKIVPETESAEQTTITQQKEPAIPVQQNTVDTSNKESSITSSTKKPKKKRKSKKKKQTSAPTEILSDQDEITLQLSDSEKMDLLEDFDRKRYVKVSNSSSEVSEDSTSESRSETSKTSACVPSTKEDLVSSTKDGPSGETKTEESITGMDGAKDASKDESLTQSGNVIIHNDQYLLNALEKTEIQIENEDVNCQSYSTLITKESMNDSQNLTSPTPDDESGNKSGSSELAVKIQTNDCKDRMVLRMV